MTINKYIPIALSALVILFLMFFAGYRYAYNTYANKNSKDTIINTKVDTVYIAGAVIRVTDTLRKTKTIRDSVYIPNPLDSVLYAEYCTIRDSLNKLNVTQDIILDTLTSNNNRVDSLNIVCNTIKQSISFTLRYGLDKQTVKTTTITVTDKSWQWDTFIYGGITGAVTYYLLTLIGK